MNHLPGWRVGAAALGTMALATGAFGLPAVFSSDTTDPAPIELKTVNGTGEPVEDAPGAGNDADSLVPRVDATPAEGSVTEPGTTIAVSVTSLVSAASNGSPISLNSPDEESDSGASTASAGSPSPAPAVQASVDSPSSPNSPSSVDSPSSLDS